MCVYVSSVFVCWCDVTHSDGNIWKGSLETGKGEVMEVDAPGPAVGLDHDRRSGYLFVCGGPTGAAPRGRCLIVFFCDFVSECTPCVFIFFHVVRCHVVVTSAIQQGEASGMPLSDTFVSTSGLERCAAWTVSRRWKCTHLYLAWIDMSPLLSHTCDSLSFFFLSRNCDKNVNVNAQGTARVYDDASFDLVADLAFSEEGEASFVNDVIITKTAAYFTDSFQPRLYKVRMRVGLVCSRTDLPG